MTMRLFLALLLLGVPSQAQWELETSNTTDNLRGIDYVGGTVAWASGSNGTVLRTEDNGATWHTCAIPPGAEQLDFRGIRAPGKSTALVMSSGKGALSRIYKTVDGCRTWRLLFTNPDGEGFWDAILYDQKTNATAVLGDPVAGRFVLYASGPADTKWSKKRAGKVLEGLPGEAAFAASNSILFGNGRRGHFLFVTGGARPEIIDLGQRIRRPIPFAAGESSGAFSLARNGNHVVIVGGDYKHPDKREGTAAFSSDGGYNFRTAQTPPNGYRSAVAYDPKNKSWIAVGPNGTDISRDNGRSWFALGAGKDWNALSLPFVVGPKGRIGKLAESAR